MGGMAVSAAAATVASFSGLRGLAEACGWAPELAWLLPITVDAYATTSARVWLAASTRSPEARRFARANALGAISVSIAGNALYHAIGAGLTTVSWPIVVAVGAIPAAVLGLTAHQHALRTRRHEPRPDSPEPNPDSSPDASEPGTEPRDLPAVRSEPKPPTPRSALAAWPPRRHVVSSDADGSGRSRYQSDDDLMAAARVADLRYRAEHDGRPITRDALRAALRIGGRRATELRRRLVAEPTDPNAVPAEPDPVPTVPAGPAPDREENPNPDDLDA